MPLRFDSTALYKALDTRPEERGLTWKQVGLEIGVAEATLKRTREGGRIEVDGMLAMVNWLGVPVETFCQNRER